jgi:hypothetical protein
MTPKLTRVRRKAVWGSGIAAAALLSALLFGGCSAAVREGRGPVSLTLLSLAGASGADPGTFGSTLSSDVLTVVSGAPTIFEDLGRAQLRVDLKDIGLPGSPNAPNVNNQITVTRYRVTFTRSDGRNTPGVDVPHSFDGAVTATIGASASDVAFVLVRAQAKEEPPLRALVGNGGAMVISTIAQVTLWGTDRTGNAVSVAGQISVNFADWGDPG